MIILPAIDLYGGKCVRLRRGVYDTAHQVAANPLEAALSFASDGAKWLHVVDLDGARSGKAENRAIIAEIVAKTGLQVELGGGIRTMQAIEDAFALGVSRVVIGSSALHDPKFVKDAVKTYAEAIAIGIDAKDGFVSVNGWTETSHVEALTLAKQMADIGVSHIIYTDIATDGMLTGPNLEALETLTKTVRMQIIASGGIRNMEDIRTLAGMKLYGAICGKSIYEGTLDLHEAIAFCMVKTYDKYFEKAELIPAIIVEEGTGEVLMLAYMNRESLLKTIETGMTWFYSRSRKELWNKGATSGHAQRVITIKADCDEDALLVTVHQTGNACHTGAKSCFFRDISK